MELKLIDGAFTAVEAEDLLRQLVTVKTNFHLNKIDLNGDAEEDMKRSESRIRELEQALRVVPNYIRANKGGKFSLRANIVVEKVEQTNKVAV
jgi:hypothetical protein